MDSQTKLCCVIGNPVGHSLSPLIHNAAFKRLGLNYAYVAFEVKDLKNAIAGIRALGIRGASVTIPYKSEVIKYLDWVDLQAKEIGACNTIVNEKGNLKGYNTDAYGALKAIHKNLISLKGKRVVIIGSGGAARAIGFALALEEKLKDLFIIGIVEEQLKKLVSDIELKTGKKVTGFLMSKNILKELCVNSDIIINCSPVGMYPEINKSPIPKEFLNPGNVVFDIVYTPKETKLLSYAKDIGCKIIYGYELFIEQAAKQFKLWTGKKAPIKIIEKFFK